MESRKRKISGREKDEASIQLLEKLQGQLHSGDPSIRRRAAYNLSWMQEDGLDILRDMLFSTASVPTKNASAYGLRKMQGRMKKKALEVLKKGLELHSGPTQEICLKALQLLGHKIPEKYLSQKRPKKPKIKEISYKSRPRRTVSNR